VTRRAKGILFLVALGGLVVGSLLSGVSLVLYKLGLWRSQLAVAGVGVMLVSVTFLIAGLAMLPYGVMTLRDGREPMWSRLIFGTVMLVVGACWTATGVQGIFWPEFLRAALGLS
jgi:hypothetical protein